MTQETFSKVMDDVISTQFEKEAVAFSESSPEVYVRVFNGQSAVILSESDTGFDGEFKFGGDVATITSALTLAKLVAETYLAIKKCWSPSDAKAIHPDGMDLLRRELIDGLSKHINSEKAVSVADSVITGLSENVSRGLV